MAARSKEEIMAALKEKFTDDLEDDTLALIEDVSDTIDHLAAESGTDWKKKYEENDAAWKKKYKERFFNSGNDAPQDPDPEPEIPEDIKPKKFEDLFKTE